MIRIRKSIRVARGVADCYRYLVDFSTSEQWDPAVYRAAKRTPGAPGVGTEFDVTVSLFGRRRELRYRIESLAPGTAIVLCGTGAAEHDGRAGRQRFDAIAQLAPTAEQRDRDVEFGADAGRAGGALGGPVDRGVPLLAGRKINEIAITVGDAAGDADTLPDTDHGDRRVSCTQYDTSLCSAVPGCKACFRPAARRCAAGWLHWPP